MFIFVPNYIIWSLCLLNINAFPKEHVIIMANKRKHLYEDSFKIVAVRDTP